MIHSIERVGDRKFQVQRFGSLAEALADTSKRYGELSGSAEGVDLSHWGLSDPKWVGAEFTTFADVVEKATSVWPEGLEIIGRMIDQIKGRDMLPPVSRRRRARYNEDAGDEVDHDRLRAGSPYWRDCVRQSITGPTSVTLVVDLSGDCSMKPDVLMWRGAAALAASDVLEDAGYSVQIYVAKAVTGKWLECDDRSFQSICAKRAGDALDIGTLASMISGWFYRSVLFATSYLIDGLTPVSNLGYSIFGLDGLAHLVGEDDVFVVANVWNEAAATKKAGEIIDRVNLAQAA